MRRALGAGLLVAALLLAGCSRGTDAPEVVEPTVAASSARAVAVPEVAPDQRFALDDLATFDDGLEVEVAGSVAGRATANDQGADRSGGEIVTASIRIGNNTDEAYDPRLATITATYGDGTVASPVVNPTEKVTGTFAEPIAVQGEGVAAAGFAIPAAELTEVTFVVDLADGTHDPVSFTGKVEQG